MAYDYSEIYFKKYNFIKTPIRYLLCKNWRIVSKYRSIFRKFDSYKKSKNNLEKNFSFEINLNSDLKEYSDFFNKNNWCFIDNFFSQETCKQIVQNWPSRHYFRPMKYISKQYDFGFEWNHTLKELPRYIEHHLHIKKLYNYLDSSDFKKIINNLCNDKFNRSCFSISLTTAKKGSVLFPHKDAISLENNNISNPAINIIIFLKGTDDQEFSGGTGLYEDNEFKKVIFEPRKLNNSALIYRSRENFFHGFKEIQGKDKVRFTLNTQFTCLK